MKSEQEIWYNMSVPDYENMDVWVWDDENLKIGENWILNILIWKYDIYKKIRKYEVKNFKIWKYGAGDMSARIWKYAEYANFGPQPHNEKFSCTDQNLSPEKQQ